MKKFVSIAFAVGVIGRLFAVNVTTESALVTALGGSDKSITVTKSFTTSKDIQIPAGYTVTLGSGVTLTLGSTTSGSGKSATTTYYKITGSGSLVEGVKRIVSDGTATLPDCGDTSGISTRANPHKGATYEKYRMVSEGGTLSCDDRPTQVTCSTPSSIVMPNGETKNFDAAPVALVCRATSGINCGLQYVRAVSGTVLAAIKDKTTTLPAGHVLLLLSSATFGTNVNVDWGRTDALVVDCMWSSFDVSAYKQINGGVNLTLLNASNVSLPLITNSSISLINCSGCDSFDYNNNTNTEATRLHFYDCNGISVSPSFSNTSNRKDVSESGGLFFYSGRYVITFNNPNYHVYGGAFNNNPDPDGDGGYIKRKDKNGNIYISEQTYKAQGDNYWYVVAPPQEVEYAAINIDTEVPYASLSEAINKVGNGQTIKLVAAANLTSPVEVANGKNFTLELDGKNIQAENGFLVNKGVLKIEDCKNWGNDSECLTATGYLIDNRNSLEITYGTYTGSILMRSGSTLIVHGGAFKGELTLDSGVTTEDVNISLRGGKFKSSVQAFLKDGYEELYDSDTGYYCVCKFPAEMTDTTFSTAEKAWKLQLMDHDDREIYRDASSSRAHYDAISATAWYTKAELKSTVDALEGAVDCALITDRTIPSGKLKVYASYVLESGEKTDRNVNPPPDLYRMIIPQFTGTPWPYGTYLNNFEYINAGISDVDGVNVGTVCMLKLQLCSTRKVSDSPVQYDVRNVLKTFATCRYMLGGKKAAIDRDGSRLSYDSLSEAVGAANDGERVLVGADTDADVMLSKVGTFTIDPYGFAFTGSVLVSEGFVVKSVEESESLASSLQGVDSVNAVTYVVARKVVVPTVENKTYNASEQVAISESEFYTVAVNAGTNVGEYTSIVALKDNKTCVWADGTTEAKEVVWSISPAQLTVIANESSKTCGQPDPDFSYGVDGLLGSDSMSGKLSRDAGENAGMYKITQGTLTAGNNYTITYTEANFIISLPESVTKVSIDSMPEDWKNDIGGGDTPPSDTVIKSILCQPDENGNAKWENLVIGQKADEKAAVTAANGGTETTANIEVSFEVPTNAETGEKIETGYTVTYAFDQVDTAGKVVDGGAGEAKEEPTLDFDKVEENEPTYFKMRAVLEATDNSGVTAEVPVEKTIGVFKVASDAEVTIIPVPWQSLGDGDIKASELVHAASLSDDDELVVYGADGKSQTWIVKNGEWTAPVAEYTIGGDVSEPQQEEQQEAAELSRGQGAILKRKDTTKEIVLIGQAVTNATETVETPIAAATSSTEPSWNLVASPKMEQVEVGTVAGANTSDEIIVPTAGTPKHYTYKNNAWGYTGKISETEVTLPGGAKTMAIQFGHKTDDPNVPAGTGFWYLNNSSGNDKKITW